MDGPDTPLGLTFCTVGGFTSTTYLTSPTVSSRPSCHASWLLVSRDTSPLHDNGGEREHHCECMSE